MCENGQPGEHDDAMLVDQEVLANALQAVEKEMPAEGFTFIETEPLLSSYCRAELLQILGKLAGAGACSGVVRGVGADIHRLIKVTDTAMKSGYGSLLEDFLPEFAAPTPESTAQPADENEPGP